MLSVAENFLVNSVTLSAKKLVCIPYDIMQ